MNQPSPVRRRKGALPHRWAETRQRIYQRDHGMCGICHTPVRPGVAWEIDHIIPRRDGGGHEDWNLRLAHKLCNARRSDGRPRGLPMARVRQW